MLCVNHGWVLPHSSSERFISIPLSILQMGGLGTVTLSDCPRQELESEMVLGPSTLILNQLRHLALLLQLFALTRPANLFNSQLQMSHCELLCREKET
jgi:hypothetical protein